MKVEAGTTQGISGPRVPSGDSYVKPEETVKVAWDTTRYCKIALETLAYVGAATKLSLMLGASTCLNPIVTMVACAATGYAIAMREKNKDAHTLLCSRTVRPATVVANVQTDNNSFNQVDPEKEAATKENEQRKAELLKLEEECSLLKRQKNNIVKKINKLTRALEGKEHERENEKNSNNMQIEALKLKLAETDEKQQQLEQRLAEYQQDILGIKNELKRLSDFVSWFIKEAATHLGIDTPADGNIEKQLRTIRKGIAAKARENHQLKLDKKHLASDLLAKTKEAEKLKEQVVSLSRELQGFQDLVNKYADQSGDQQLKTRLKKTGFVSYIMEKDMEISRLKSSIRELERRMKGMVEYSSSRSDYGFLEEVL